MPALRLFASARAPLAPDLRAPGAKVRTSGDDDGTGDGDARVQVPPFVVSETGHELGLFGATGVGRSSVSLVKEPCCITMAAHASTTPWFGVAFVG